MYEHSDFSLYYYRLLEEINEVLGDKTAVSAEDVEKLTYTEQVCKSDFKLITVCKQLYPLDLTLQYLASLIMISC